MAEKFYNRIAQDYDNDWNNIYKDTRSVGIGQILEHCGDRTLDAALDLAVGTGNSFADLERHISIRRRTGNDLSSEMLKQAARKIQGPVEFICDDARNILHHVPQASQDLILCHYLFSYLDSDLILDTAFKLLKPGGFISLATTTKQNLLELSTGRFRHTGRLFRVGNHLSKVDTPENHQACLDLLATHQFQVVRHSNYRKEALFRSFADVISWAVDSGWAAQYFDSGFRLKVLLGRLLFAGAAVVMHPLYPIIAHSDISIVLAVKSGTESSYQRKTTSCLI